MAKGTKVRDQDKFMLRLPDGLRGRIKAKADVGGVSMNEAIVSVLEREFPEPITLETRLERLRGSLLFLKGEGADLIVDDLLNGVSQILTEIASGVVDASDVKREQIQKALERWEGEDKARNETDVETAKKVRNTAAPWKQDF